MTTATAHPPKRRSPVAPALPADLALRLEIDRFNADYAATLDRGNLLDWPAFFDENPVYSIVSRENFDRGLPMGVVYCDSHGMLEDRARAVMETMVYDPRTVLHLITNLQIVNSNDPTSIEATANFLLIETLLDRMPQLLMAGRYVDRFARVADRLLLKERRCVYDTTIIRTSVVYPV